MENIENELVEDGQVEEEQEIIEGQGSEPEVNEAESDEISDNQEASEESAEEAHESERTKGKHWTRDKALLDKVRRENYRNAAMIQELQAELARKEQETAELRYLSNVTTQNALYHYEASAKERLDRARDVKQAALESADAKAITDADDAYAKAVFEYEKLRNLKAEQEVQEQNFRNTEAIRQQAQQFYTPPQPQKPYLTPENIDIANKWASENDWFMRQSPNYDRDREMAANQICDSLDSYYRQNGAPHMIGSEQYFEDLDDQLTRFYPQYTERNTRPMSQANQARQPQMSQQSVRQNNQSYGAVAPVKGARSPVQSKNLPPLNNMEKTMAQRLGVSEKQYQMGKLKHLKNDYFGEQISQSKR